MYYFALIYLLVLVLLRDKLKDKNRILIAFLPLLAIIILRYGVGADYFSYERIHHNLNPNDIYGSLKSMPKIEVLYKIIDLAALKIGLSYHTFAALIAGGLTFLTLKWFDNNSPNFFLSALLHFTMLFFYWNLSALRQGIVVTLLLYIYFNGKNEFSIKIKIIATIVLFFMHPTAIIVPIIYLLSEIPWSRKGMLILLLLAPFSRLLFNEEFLLLLTKIPYLEKALKYISYNPIQYLSLPTLLRFSFFSLILLHYDKLKKAYPNYVIMFNFSLLSLLMYFYLPTSMVIGTRVTIFGYYLTTIIFPMILSLYTKEKIYPIVLTGFIGLSGVSFLNEFSKLTDRTGYMYSMHQLNFETVLNKNRNHFGNMYAFHLDVNEKNQDVFKESELKEKVNKKYYMSEQTYNSELQHFSVYFPKENKYGIINTEGKIVIKPIYKNRISVYNNLIELDLGQRSFSSKYYKAMNEAGFNLYNYDEVKEIVDKYVEEMKRLNSKQLGIEKVSPVFLSGIEFLESYNLNPVKEVEIIKYKEDDYSYVKMKTNYESYFIILKNNEPVIEKIYTDIVPFNEKGILIGFTESHKDFVNESGSIIWYE